jgi:hypothetical protein
MVARCQRQLSFDQWSAAVKLITPEKQEARQACVHLLVN